MFNLLMQQTKPFAQEPLALPPAEEHVVLSKQLPLSPVHEDLQLYMLPGEGKLLTEFNGVTGNGLYVPSGTTANEL